MTVGSAKRIALGLGVLLLLPIALWGQFQGSRRLLAPLRVGTVEVPGEPRAAQRVLRQHADAWASTELRIQLGEGASGVPVSRGSLGAMLDVDAALREALQLGRSRNPLIDGAKWWAAQRGQLVMRWAPSLDSALLSEFIESQQRRVETPPIAGITDGQGFTLPGRDGQALDHATAMLLLQRALVSGAEQVSLPLQRVLAPPPITMGSPDGALFEGESEPVAQGAPGTPGLPVREPAAWLPANTDDCYHAPPQRPFCDGPRRVPAPRGPAAQLAQQVGLGSLETFARLMRQGPLPAWVQAAGGPSGSASLAWPVPDGKLGRGFGYVRKAELRDRIHAGVDIAAPRGSAVHAAAPGIVAYSDNRVRGYGNLLAIVHDNGSVTLSAHCQQIFVFAGERVERGQVVAQVGMTGLALGPHLHFEYHVQGRATDPEPSFVR